MPLPIEHLLISYVPIWILKLVFPLKEDVRERDREMKVLCLGLGRTGTDSLRTALSELGYDDVAHGWYFMTEQNVELAIHFERLNRAKKGPFPNPAYLTTRSFDAVFGSCAAITDLTGAKFASELLHAYPNAKVILNRRRDLDAWYTSQLNTIDKINTDWPSWTRQWFDAECFWIGRMLYWAKSLTKFNFAQEGKGFYRAHYEGLEGELRDAGREWLDWYVEDGWGPLCGFLGVETPERGFPNENAGGKFMERRFAVHAKRAARADRKMMVTAVGLFGLVVAGVAWWGLK